MTKPKLYRCPYDKACTCTMDEPCKGCETWSQHFYPPEDERGTCDRCGTYTFVYGDKGYKECSLCMQGQPLPKQDKEDGYIMLFAWFMMEDEE